MNVLQISDNINNRANIEYIQQKVQFSKECECNIFTSNYRINAFLLFSENNINFEKFVLDILAEVVCVSYKYNLFNKNVSTAGISSIERELLLSAIIAADFDDDKRYVIAKMPRGSIISIDGLFNFCLQKLLRKWNEISDYIPRFFTHEDLEEFLNFLINEKKGRRVFIERENVYDWHRTRLERTKLIPKGNELCLLKEILLSGAGEVFIAGKINKIDFEWLSKFYGKKISIL